MLTEQANEGMLNPYRVLDLTDERGFLCGKLLGDLGADVIKIERPGGDRSRNLGPFYHDEPNPEKSLHWFAFNNNKRGITLNIETTDGQSIFRKLSQRADFIVESFPPGYMDRLGLGYSVLEKINPGIIMISITPFGQTGPYRDYRASDIVLWALGGQMYLYGDEDRPPIRISHHPQAYLLAATEAAVGATMALHHRRATGEGQHVDVSIQECVAKLAYSFYWSLWKIVRRRGDDYDPNRYATIMRRSSGENSHRAGENHLHVERIWPCKDGYVIWLYWSGPYAKRWSLPFVKWMVSEGMTDSFLREFDWNTYDHATTTQEIVDRIEEPTRRFFMTRTRAELYKAAIEHRFKLYPVFDASDLLQSAQLAARGFWARLDHPELGTTIIYPGAFVVASEAPLRVVRRPPLVGEHNRDIYETELGFSKEDLTVLRQANII